jgi:hypothetical protein
VLDDEIVELITPFYLKMMGMNARIYGAHLLLDVAVAARTLDAADVIQLLRADWRPRVMGAWFALPHDEPEVTDAVLRSLETSLGNLTSPPLAVTAVVLAARDALSALAHYAASDAENHWGACGFAAAAAEHFEGSVCCPATEADRSAFDELHIFAEQLRGAP